MSTDKPVIAADPDRLGRCPWLKSQPERSSGMLFARGTLPPKNIAAQAMPETARMGFFTRLTVAVGLSWMITSQASAQTVLINEPFEDANFAARGWYDTTGGALSTVETYTGTRSFECRFVTNGTKCVGGDVARHKFTATESIYIAYYIKHSANWVGSGKSYHPHMFTFTTNVDGDYIGAAYSHLTTYIETNGGTPVFIVQDGRNIDETKIGVDLTKITENRAVGGCNGDSDGYGNGDCYPSGTVHWNDKWWRANRVYFDNNASGPYYKNTWHLVEAYFQLNSIVGGVGARDGVIRYWYDGALIMEHTNIVLRTGANAAMKFNQLQLLPYIGDGSPVDQSFWVDNLLIATSRPATPPQPPGPPLVAPRAPTNLHIIP